MHPRQFNDRTTTSVYLERSEQKAIEERAQRLGISKAAYLRRLVRADLIEATGRAATARHPIGYVTTVLRDKALNDPPW